MNASNVRVRVHSSTRDMRIHLYIYRYTLSEEKRFWRIRLELRIERQLNVVDDELFVRSNQRRPLYTPVYDTDTDLAEIVNTYSKFVGRR